MGRGDLTTARMVSLFLLGCLMLLPPVMLLPNRPERVLGLPALYLYVFFVWSIVILLAAIAVRAIDPDDKRSEPRRDDRTPESTRDA